MFIALVKACQFSPPKLCNLAKSYLAYLKPATGYTKKKSTILFCIFQKPLLTSFKNTFSFRIEKKYVEQKFDFCEKIFFMKA